MFNLDFSGLFSGGGGFTLDTSKFNFDAYKAPEPKKEAVVDPVDVVSDKSPTPDVEVLEGAGTVAVTKPDPITQAIEALKGKDLSNDFNVNPIASAPIAPTPVATQPVAPVIPTPVAPTPVVKQPPKTPVAPTVVPIKEEIGNVISDGVKALAPDPIEQAIQTVKPTGFSQDLASNLQSLSGITGSQGMSSGAGFMDVVEYGDAADIYKMSTIEAPNVDAYNDIVTSAVESNVLYDPEEVNNKLKEIDSTGGKISYLNSLITDEFLNWKESQSEEFWDNSKITEIPDLGFGVVSTGSAMGVPTEIGGELNFRTGLEELQKRGVRVGDDQFIKFNNKTNQFEFVDETSDLEITGQIATAIAVSMATAGAGSALSAGLGISSTAGAALASGAVAAAQGGDLEEVATKAFSGGLSEYIDTLEVAASAADATKEAVAIADTMKAIETSVDVVKAVDSGNVLKAVSGVLDLTGNGSPASYIKDALGTTDAQTAGILKVMDKQLQGESLDDSLRSGAVEWVKEGGVKELGLSMDFGDSNWETPEAIKAIGDTLLEGASWANEKFVQPVVNTVETLGAGAIEAASQANQFVQREVIDEVQVLMSEQNETFQAAIEPIKEEFSQLNQSVRTDLANFDKEYLQPVKEEISVINQNVRNELALFDDETLQPIKEDIENVITKVDTTLSAFNQDYIKPIDEKLSQTNKDVRDQLSGFEDDYLDPIKDDIETMAGNLKDGLSDTNQYVRDQLSSFDDDVLQPIKGQIESAIESISGLDVDMSGVQDMLGSLWDSINGLNTGLAATQEKFGRPSADKSPLVKMRTQYGEQYEFEDLRNNPLLNNEFLS